MSVNDVNLQNAVFFILFWNVFFDLNLEFWILNFNFFAGSVYQLERSQANASKFWLHKLEDLEYGGVGIALNTNETLLVVANKHKT